MRRFWSVNYCIDFRFFRRLRGKVNQILWPFRGMQPLYRYGDVLANGRFSPAFTLIIAFPAPVSRSWHRSKIGGRGLSQGRMAEVAPGAAGTGSVERREFWGRFFVRKSRKKKRIVETTLQCTCCIVDVPTLYVNIVETSNSVLKMFSAPDPFPFYLTRT